jgi:hypothetical protein
MKTDSTDSATIAPILVEAGMDLAITPEREQAGAIAIQGALIPFQGLNDPTHFQRVMRN